MQDNKKHGGEVDQLQQMTEGSGRQEDIDP
jgi:hypothetical protein